MASTNEPRTPMAEHVREMINRHDLDGLVALFADDYQSEQPAHPLRAFTGPETVREHWSGFFASAPDFGAEIVASVRDRDREWVEWRWHGTTEAGPVEVRGVVISELEGDRIRGARIYMEPVETETTVHSM